MGSEMCIRDSRYCVLAVIYARSQSYKKISSICFISITSRDLILKISIFYLEVCRFCVLAVIYARSQSSQTILCLFHLSTRKNSIIYNGYFHQLTVKFAAARLLSTDVEITFSLGSRILKKKEYDNNQAFTDQTMGPAAAGPKY